MLDISPEVGAPRPVRLADYRAPEFLIDTVELVFALEDGATRVKSRLGIRRNPEAADPKAALALDGEELALVSVALDGLALGPNRYRLPAEGGLVIDEVPDAFALDIETVITPDKNTALSGLYMSGGNFCTQCEPEGFRRITYFIDRPDVMARYSTTIVADQTRFPVLLSNGNPAGVGRGRGRQALGEMGRSAPQALVSVRAGRGRPGGGARPVHDARGPRGGAGDLGAARRRGQMRPRDGVAEEGDGMGRGGVRPRIRSGCVQHRRGQRLQHGGDGEQGAQHLQHALCTGQAGDRDRRRLPGHRVGDRPRILSQLDRQPGDLPRLVPIVAEGRADRVPRPGILGRSGEPRGQAHRRGAHAQGDPVSRG